MCGRIFIRPSSTSIYLVESLGVNEPHLPELNNVAPTETVPVIYNNGRGATVRNMRWSLHPTGSRKPPGHGPGYFVADVEELRTKPHFQVAVEEHRGIIPADAFIEWNDVDKIRQPFYVQGKRNRLP